MTGIDSLIIYTCTMHTHETKFVVLAFIIAQDSFISYQRAEYFTSVGSVILYDLKQPIHLSLLTPRQVALGLPQYKWSA